MAKDSYLNYASDNQPELETLSRKLLEKINEENSSIPKLAETLGLGEMTLRRLVNGEKSYSPNIKILYPIANYFNCSILDLMSENYSITVPSFQNITDFENDLNYKIKSILVSKNIYLKQKYGKLVHLHYYQDLNDLFRITTETPSIIKPFGCIIILDDKLNFGYLEPLVSRLNGMDITDKNKCRFNSFTAMQSITLAIKNIKMVAVKEETAEIAKNQSSYITTND